MSCVCSLQNNTICRRSFVEFYSCVLLLQNNNCFQSLLPILLLLIIIITLRPPLIINYCMHSLTSAFPESHLTQSCKLQTSTNSTDESSQICTFSFHVMIIVPFVCFLFRQVESKAEILHPLDPCIVIGCKGGFKDYVEGISVD